MNNAPNRTLSIGFLNVISISEKPSVSASGETASFISCIPYISTANPTMIVPMSCRFFFLLIISIAIPIKAMMGAKFSGFSIETAMLSLLMPAVLSSHAVNVVPILEPIITPTVCSSCIMPELTSPTSMTVRADDDCTAMVIPAPSARLLTGFEVIFFSVLSSLPPATFSRLFDITCIPKRKNANPPHRVHIE